MYFAPRVGPGCQNPKPPLGHQPLRKDLAQHATACLFDTDIEAGKLEPPDHFANRLHIAVAHLRLALTVFDKVMYPRRLPICPLARNSCLNCTTKIRSQKTGNSPRDLSSERVHGGELVGSHFAWYALSYRERVLW